MTTKTAREVETEFREELQALLTKYKATLEVEYDGYRAEVCVDTEAEYNEDYEKVVDYTHFSLGSYVPYC